jgi:aspartate racemase
MSPMQVHGCTGRPGGNSAGFGADDEGCAAFVSETDEPPQAQGRRHGPGWVIASQTGARHRQAMQGNRISRIHRQIDAATTCPGGVMLQAPSTRAYPQHAHRMPAMLHIGLVACSAEGAALCYRTICTEGPQWLGTHAHPEVSMHTPSLADYMACIERDDWMGVGEIMLSSARKLADMGADFLICPDNTLHQALPFILARSPLPWLHIAEVVAAQAVQRGHRRLGLTGTRWLVDSDVYPEKLAARALEWVRPTAAEREELHRIIMDELVPGISRPMTVAALQRIIRGLRHQGCDAVVLGCTELPLVMDEAHSPLPTLDSTRLLARAALRRATQGLVPVG